MNDITFGLYRENCLLSTIAHFPYISSHIILRFNSNLFCNIRNQDTKLRKLQEILRRMYKAHKVKRFRIATGEYIYHIDNRKSKQWKHKYMRNLYIAENNIKEFQYEYNFGYGIADALYKKGFWYFLEVDTGSHEFSQNVKKYELYYDTKRWGQTFKSFPDIIIYTTRPDSIKKQIKNSNVYFKIIPCYV